MKYAGIIFDLDGVICSTDHYHYLAWKQLADRLGIPFDEQANNRLRGVSRMESLDVILSLGKKQYTDEDKRAMAEEKNKTYRQLLRQMSADDLSGEVKSTLDKLRGQKLLLAIGSSSKNAPFILDRLGLVDYFNVVADGNGISRSKPDPEVFLLAAEGLGLSPGECLVVEDAHAGVQAAAAGGFDCAAMGDARDNPMAVYHLETFEDLGRIFCVDKNLQNIG